jgi:hypothetical protein
MANDIVLCIMAAYWHHPISVRISCKSWKMRASCMEAWTDVKVTSQVCSVSSAVSFPSLVSGKEFLT